MGCVESTPTDLNAFRFNIPAEPTAANPPHQACFSCGATGWSHDSTMDHIAPPNQMCFFCKTCVACNGRGTIPADCRRCTHCEGFGWRHESLMEHKATPGRKCFFCTPCPQCCGVGAIRGDSSCAPVIHGGVRSMSTMHHVHEQHGSRYNGIMQQ